MTQPMKTKQQISKTQPQRTYLIPITESYGYEFTYLTHVYANTPQEAYTIAKNNFDDRIVKEQDDYEHYNELLKIEPKVFHVTQKDAIMTLSFSNSKEYKHMAFFQANWNNYTEELSNIASPENWSNTTYPNRGILANYIVKTYDKLSSEKNIIIRPNYALFNTCLFTKYQEPIYCYQSGFNISFLTGYELSNIGVSERPERANYFEHPELLLFDWHYPIDIQYKHILEDENNKKRLPKDLLSSDNIVTILNGAIETMKKRVSSNYKLAIPQYYDGKIQLLLPLCLCNDNKPDVAIAVTKKDNCYQGHTCLTLDMAYNNARLIAKPESNWLSTT